MSTPSTATVTYRCVCGNSVQLDREKGGVCEQCNRRYSGRSVNASMSMTLGMPSDAGIQPEEDDNMVGQSLDHFTIIDRLGGGGMGTVYRALDESLQRYVAIKVIRRGASGAAETHHVERLLQEARAQARVNHANVVHIYFVSRDEQMPYLAMELVPGSTLSVRLSEEQPLAYREMIRIGLQTAQALRESAQFDIVHGDIKPSNILLHESNAKLSDFGLSHRISRTNAEDAKVAGTPNYMAPEVCRSEPATVQSDMYSFGVMLFEMTFGRLPYSFSDSTIESRLTAHQTAAPEFPATWPMEVPEAWRPFLQKLLAKEPTQRFKDWESLITEMQSLRPVRPVAAGRLQRAIAWGVDLLILGAVQAIVMTPFVIINSQFRSFLVDLLSMGSLFIAPAIVMLWAGKGRVSPGKKLMQLRVVDRHGLRPRPRKLAWRSVLQYLPIWCVPIVGLTEFISIPVQIAVTLFVGADILFAVFRPGRQSIHDRIFGTRVVLPESSS